MAYQFQNCICGVHSIPVPISVFASEQVGQLQTSIPHRADGVFPIENLDESISNPESELCLDVALDAVAYWLENNEALRKTLRFCVVDYETASLSTADFFTTLLDQSPPLLTRLESFLSKHALPRIRIHSDLKAKFHQQTDLYGAFNPDESDVIYLNSALLKQGLIAPDKTLPVAFLIFAKVLHELCHWISHFTMKKERHVGTPLHGVFEGEMGEWFEKAIFGGIVEHRSQSGFCPWYLELVMKDKDPVSKVADIFEPGYMAQFFKEETVRTCKNFKDLQGTCYTSTIRDSRLASVQDVSSKDELVNASVTPPQLYTRNISLEGSNGMDFLQARDVIHSQN